MEEETTSAFNDTYMNLDEFHRDSAGYFDMKSLVPEMTKSEPCCMGIDEAGRGPVLGPMVYSTSYCPLSQDQKLKDLGFADSKTLNEEEREELFKAINENNNFLGWITRILSPNYISNEMLRRTKYNLNQISHDTAIWLIKSVIENGVDLQQVYVDTVGDPKKYQKKLEHEFPHLKITVKAKADALFPIVSAASICAKVARDRVIQTWKFIENMSFPTEYGSGYPADPATKKWLATIVDRIFGFPQFVRFSWSTCKEILDKQCAPVEWDDDNEEETAKDLKGTASITSFFGKSNNKAEIKPHQFFQERCLEPVTFF
ncbi:ribonuclease H2 subunit A-like [Dendronephthya gigantea]|uniref:ribonuclease H2 subunit A-like n=1 Tax=Dendronephthya gigantea TaxID=151771 RepID=UPI001069915E|nr:ribonuclease H2 subunit A-like [Dendronephthya gigantea]